MRDKEKENVERMYEEYFYYASKWKECSAECLRHWIMNKVESALLGKELVTEDIQLFSKGESSTLAFLNRRTMLVEEFRFTNPFGEITKDVLEIVARIFEDVPQHKAKYKDAMFRMKLFDEVVSDPSSTYFGHSMACLSVDVNS